METEVKSLAVGFQGGEETVLGGQVSVRRNVLQRVVQGLLLVLRVLDTGLRRSIAVVTIRTHMLQCSFTYDCTSLLSTLRMKSASLILFEIVSDGREAILIAHQKFIFVNNMGLRVVLHN